VNTKPRPWKRSLDAVQMASMGLASLTYLVVAILTVKAHLQSDMMAPVPLVAVLGVLGLLQMLLVLAFLGSVHALWAGLIIQAGALLVAVVHVGPVSWVRALCYAGMVSILTYNWLKALEGEDAAGSCV